MSAKKILIVDDDPDYVMATKMVLEGEGYQVLEASEPQSAMEVIKQNRPDLILLDVMMVNETDGFHLAKALKDDAETANIPILMMTAIGKKRDFVYEGEKDKEYLPVDDYLEKPTPPEQLKERIGKLLA